MVDRPVRPTAAVIGGAKVSTKIPVLTNLAGKVDKLIIGAAWPTRSSWHRASTSQSLAGSDFKGARDHAPPGAGLEVLPPMWVAPKFEAGAPSRVVPVLETPSDG